MSNKYKNHPPKWSDFEKHARNYPLVKRVFKGGVSEVNRFSARYRLAKSFQGLTLDDFSADTTDGYAALLRLTLCWSAFEAFLEATGRNKHHVSDIGKRFDFGDLNQDLRLADVEGKFFQFILARVENKNQQNIVRAHLAGENVCGLTLAKVARHIFVHGPLTPNVGQLSPASVAAICHRLSLGVLNILDSEFDQHITRLVDTAGPRLPKERQ